MTDQDPGPATPASGRPPATPEPRSQAERTLGHDPKSAPWMAWGTGTDARPAPDPDEPITDEFSLGEATGADGSAEPPRRGRLKRTLGVVGIKLPLRPPTIAALIAVIVAGLGASAWALSGSDGGSPPARPQVAGAAPPVATPRELPPATAEDQIGKGHVALKVTSQQLLRTRPAADGQLVAKVGRRTPYGSQVILPVLKARGDWVAVVSPYRKNNRVAWTKVKPGTTFVAVDYSIAIRVRSRLITVRKNGKVVRRMKAAVGQVTHPTPPGRYSVTDGLIFRQKVRGPYGCCALVLSARQTRLPPQWTGGDRIAIHGTSNKNSIGLAASLGCLRVGDEAARWLVRNVPAGATVFVRG